MARPQLPAARLHVLSRRLAQLGEDAALVQLARDGARPFGVGPREGEAVDGVVRNQVQHRVLAGEKANQAVDLVGAVVDAVEQRPLHLHRVAGRARIGVAERDQLVGRDLGGARQQARAHRRVGAVQRERERRLDAALRQALEDPAVADGREHQLLVADAAAGAEQVDRFEHGLEVVRRLAHAHEDDLGHRSQAPRERDLGDDLRAAQLPLEAADAGHAEDAADGAADLARHAEAAARQQHGFDRAAVGEADEQAARPVGAGVVGAQHGERVQLGLEGRQRFTQRARQEVFRPAPAVRLRLRTRPLAQHAFLVHRLRAEPAQALAQRGDVQRGHAVRPLGSSVRRSASKNSSDCMRSPSVWSRTRSAIDASTGTKGRPVDCASTCAMHARSR